MHNRFSTQSPLNSIYFCQRLTGILKIPFLKKYFPFSWNHWITAAFLLQLPYPKSACAYIYQQIYPQALPVFNVDRKIFFRNQEVNKGTLFESYVPTVFDWHWAGVMNSCGLKVMFGGGKILRHCVEPVLSSFHYTSKKYEGGGKTFQPVLV